MDTLNENKDFFDSITSNKLDNLENEIKELKKLIHEQNELIKGLM